MKKHGREIQSSSRDNKEIYSSSKTNKKNTKRLQKGSNQSGKGKRSKKPWNAKRVFLTLGKIFVACSLIGVITLSIVITGLTVYVMKGSETESTISLDKEDIIDSGVTTIYGMDESGEYQEVSKISSGTICIWVDITDIPDNVKNAYVAIEDKRFYEHEGVDFKRTFLAFLNMFLHFWDTEQGGSTITQQLVKNLTNDKDPTPARKIREISRAMSLERTYSKDQILQAYLNIVPVGGANGDYEGVGAAAKLYFNKDIQDVTLAEAASIAAITKSPSYYEPIGHPDHNKERRDVVLKNMLDQGMITQTEYEEAVNTPVEVHPGKVVGNTNGKDYQSYFVDTVMWDVIEDLEEEKGIDEDQATQEIKSGGYKIYTTMDIELQEKLEQKYSNPATFGWSAFNDSTPESAMVIYDMNGAMKAVVGGTGDKPPGDRSCINRATQSLRRPGSSIKPLSVYAPAIDKNLITYSTIVDDEPLNTDPETGKPWPQNYSSTYSGKVPVYYAVEQSLNTVPARLVQQLTPSYCYDFLTQKLGFTGLQEDDKNISPMALGNFTQGVHINELTNAYQIFGNGGNFTPSYTYTTVTDLAGDVVLENDISSTRVIESDSATVVNRLLRNVVKEGTGTKASLDNMGIEVIGKTGTTDDFKDYTFVGMTHDYIAGIWLGFDDPKSMGSTNNSTKIWHTIMSYLLNDRPQEDFALDPTVVEAEFCTDSGMLADNGCPNTKTGYYRKSNVPATCTEH